MSVPVTKCVCVVSICVVSWFIRNSSELSGECVELEAMSVHAASFLLMIIAQNSLRLGSDEKLFTKMIFSSMSSK